MGYADMNPRCTCGLCGYGRSIERKLRVYATGGEEINVIGWPCWCWKCGDVELSEYIPSADEILDECRAWRRRDRDREYQIAQHPVIYKPDEFEPSVMDYLCREI